MTMASPGFQSLGQYTITSAGTQVSEAVTDIEGMVALAIQARFAYGSGGTSAKLYIQTSLDQGTTWIDIACMVFGTASEVAIINLSAMTPKTTAVVPGDGVLTDDTVIDGVLGDRLRTKLVTLGTYAGSTVLNVGAVLR